MIKLYIITATQMVKSNELILFTRTRDVTKTASQAFHQAFQHISDATWLGNKYSTDGIYLQFYPDILC